MEFEESREKYLKEMYMRVHDAKLLDYRARVTEGQYQWELGYQVFGVVICNTLQYFERNTLFKFSIMGYPIKVNEKDPDVIKLWRLIE